MAHVRTYQLGQHAELSQKILNELAAAKACLLHREKKAAYDAKLRVHLARGTSTTAEPAVPHPVVAELSHVSATLQDLPRPPHGLVPLPAGTCHRTGNGLPVPQRHVVSFSAS